MSEKNARLGVRETFGLTTPSRFAADLGEILHDGLVTRKRFQFSLSSAGLLKPRLAVPAYLRVIPEDGLAPIYNLFDRTGKGAFYSQRVSRSTCRDFRGKRLTYDEHDGVDFVCPIGTPLVAAAPGICVFLRSRFLRGGLTVGIDHGKGFVTQYTHCARSLVELGAHVRRGQPIALSGASGIDLLQFFPWVPPHVHFLVSHRGRPQDPFRKTGEGALGATWWRSNAPSTPTGYEADPDPSPSPVDEGALESAIDSCESPELRALFGLSLIHISEPTRPY